MLLKNRNIVVTGCESGLGKYLYECLPNSFGLTRENSKFFFKENRDIDLVIHCAFNAKSSDKFQLLQDNVFLTKKLCELKPKKFVYISSIDVYNPEITNYNLLKMFAESVVANMCNNFLILRCSAMLGADMRKNNFLKIVQDEEPELSLAAGSVLNFVLHSDIKKIILRAYSQDISGFYDVISNNNISLSEIADYCNKKCSFGSFKYLTYAQNNVMLLKDFEFMDKTSLEVVREFMEQTND